MPALPPWRRVEPSAGEAPEEKTRETPRHDARGGRGGYLLTVSVLRALVATHVQGWQFYPGYGYPTHRDYAYKILYAGTCI